MEDDKKCCICGRKIEGYGNNAEPYKDGRCCDQCNYKFVIPFRIRLIMKAKVGDRIRIIHLKGETDHYDGAEGVVEYIDSMGQLHGTWGGLAVIPEEDDFIILDKDV